MTLQVDFLEGRVVLRLPRLSAAWRLFRRGLPPELASLVEPAEALGWHWYLGWRGFTLKLSPSPNLLARCLVRHLRSR
ncbi:MAG: hypothetical protein MK108_08275 [Mariniblastus sp.]|nr:hypothetical protein [Mariniblastus sp.]